MKTEFEVSPWGRIYVVHNQGALRPDDDDQTTRAFAVDEVVTFAVTGGDPRNPHRWRRALVLADTPAGGEPIRVQLPQDLRRDGDEEAAIDRACVLAVTTPPTG